MRSASFNLGGARGEDGRGDPSHLGAALAALDVDLLALQEVDRDQDRSGRADQTAVAATALGVEGPDHVRFEPALWGTPGTPGATVVPGAPGDPSYGVALVSRLPVRDWRRVDLPYTSFALPVPLEGPRPGAPPTTWLADEPRVAVAAVLAVAAPVATVVTTHLSFVPGVNAVQLRRLAAAVADLPSPLLLLGDLNLPAAVPRLLLGRRGRWRSLDAPATFPARDPRLRLDQALLRDGATGGARAAAPTVRTVRTGVSDHRALVLDLPAADLRPPAA